MGPRKGFGPAYRRCPKTGCWNWARAKDKDGYGYFKSDGKVILAHRFYYEQKHGPIPAHLEPDHTCRNRGCVNPDHIEPVTHLENVRRSTVCNGKMTMEKAREIRALKGQVKQKDIAARYGISQSLVAHIQTNRVWREVAHVV